MNNDTSVVKNHDFWHDDLDDRIKEKNALCTVMIVAWLIGKQMKTGSGRHL